MEKQKIEVKLPPVDDLEKMLLRLPKKALADKLINIHCEINSLSYGEIRSCLEYPYSQPMGPPYIYPGEEAENAAKEHNEMRNKMHDAVARAFDLCDKIVIRHLK